MLKEVPCKRLCLLTGTPLQNNTDKLWTLLNFLEKVKFPSLEKFSVEFGNLESSE